MYGPGGVADSKMLQIDAVESTPRLPQPGRVHVRRPWLAQQPQAQRRLGQRRKREPGLPEDVRTSLGVS
jgi:hypothetical protein